jgi:protein required for attachment to host cells
MNAGSDGWNILMVRASELSFQCFNEDNMDANWILSANGSRARFFSQTQMSEPLEEINDMVNEALRLRTAETESDKIGPTAATKSSHNTGAPVPNKAYEPNQTPDEHQMELFARDVAEYLKKAHQEGRFQQLSLVASPQFLGILRKLIGPNLESLVKVEINKDYTQASPEQLREQIQAQKDKH